jgi:hypothetical protein
VVRGALKSIAPEDKKASAILKGDAEDLVGSKQF